MKVYFLTKSFTICTLHQILVLKEDDISGSRGTHVQNRKFSYTADRDVAGRIT
jgi:hypothetical protein